MAKSSEKINNPLGLSLFMQWTSGSGQVTTSDTKLQVVIHLPYVREIAIIVLYVNEL